eukprot:1176865-Prorocentrum_minimum.AAC.1
MFAGILRQLSPGGVALTVTRPQEVDYPLFEAARQVRPRTLELRSCDWFPPREYGGNMLRLILRLVPASGLDACKAEGSMLPE